MCVQPAVAPYQQQDKYDGERKRQVQNIHGREQDDKDASDACSDKRMRTLVIAYPLGSRLTPCAAIIEIRATNGQDEFDDSTDDRELPESRPREREIAKVAGQDRKIEVMDD